MLDFKITTATAEVIGVRGGANLIFFLGGSLLLNIIELTIFR